MGERERKRGRNKGLLILGLIGENWVQVKCNYLRFLIIYPINIQHLSWTHYFLELTRCLQVKPGNWKKDILTFFEQGMFTETKISSGFRSAVGHFLRNCSFKGICRLPSVERNGTSLESVLLTIKRQNFGNNSTKYWRELMGKGSTLPIF